MATLADKQTDFSRLPDLPADVFTAPLKKPEHVGEDWLEPQQTEYGSEDDAIWNDLFSRQMDILPGRAASAFMAGLQSSISTAAACPNLASCPKTSAR